MTKRKIAFLFPGQGAQYVGMGRDFYEQSKVAKELFDSADQLLGKKLSQVIFEGPEELLVQTEQCQLAIFVNSMAILAAIKELYPDLSPTVCAGLSLGEYSAVCASGRLSFADCLSFVQTRARAMQYACEQTDGAMAAIFGLSAEQIDALAKGLNLPQDLWVANYNCPGQTVISGTQKGVEAASLAAKDAGAKRVIPLKVHGAFHSGLMQSALEPLSKKVNASEIGDSEVSLVMNVTGKRAQSVDEIRTNLIEQVTHSVRWEQTIDHIRDEVDLFIEIGCGKTLSGMNRQMKVDAPTIFINKVEDLQKLGE